MTATVDNCERHPGGDVLPETKKKTIVSVSEKEAFTMLSLIKTNKKNIVCSFSEG